MKEECIVSKIKGKTAYINLANKEHCGGCKACALGRSTKANVPAFMDVDCKTGDHVLVETPQRDLTLAALIIYAIPLVFLVIGFFLGGIIASKTDLKNADLIKFACSVALMIFSFFPCFLLDFFVRQKREYRHIIIKVIEKNNIPKNVQIQKNNINNNEGVEND